jgi:hypothetical protein
VARDNREIDDRINRCRKGLVGNHLEIPWGGIMSRRPFQRNDILIPCEVCILIPFWNYHLKRGTHCVGAQGPVTCINDTGDIRHGDVGLERSGALSSRQQIFVAGLLYLFQRQFFC